MALRSEGKSVDNLFRVTRAYASVYKQLTLKAEIDLHWVVTILRDNAGVCGGIQHLRLVTVVQVAALLPPQCPILLGLVVGVQFPSTLTHTKQIEEKKTTVLR